MRSYDSPRSLRSLGRKGAVSRLWPDHGLPGTDRFSDYIEGASWWLCTSRRSLQQLNVAMRRQEVAIVLYEQLGTIFELGRTKDGQYVLAAQLVRPGGMAEWALDLGLSDAGIVVQEPYDEHCSIDL